MTSQVSYQLISTAGIRTDFKTPPNERARLNTGFLCNYGCEFCYYKDRLSERDSLDKIKDRIDDIYYYGIRQIDLSGGESSIEPNWFKILDYCKERGMQVSTLSHGGKFADIEFLKKSKEHGLQEILFSLHGSNPELHDKITNRKGSFDRIILAIKNAKELNIRIRLNCTVYDLNNCYLDTEYAELLKQLKPFQVNFITLNYDTDNSDFRQVNYEEITDSIKKCIDLIKDDIEYINVRYVPFCYMIGYEKYVVNYYQHIYDIHDWNLAIYNHEIDTTRQYTKQEKLKQSYDAAKHFRMNGYTKTAQCRECKHYFICDGIEKQLMNNKFKPMHGKYIHNVNHYRKFD